MSPRPTLAQGVTMDDVARAAQVSRATVSRVLTGSSAVTTKTRDKVLAAVEELHYVPNMMAQQLASRSRDHIGLLLRDPRNPTYGLLHSELQTWCHNLGMQLITIIPSKDQGGEYEVAGLRRLLGLRVAGLLVATGVMRTEALEAYDLQVPVVSVGRPEDNPAVHAVSYDEVAHGKQIAQLAYERGHHRIAVVRVAPAVSISENLRGITMINEAEMLGMEVTVLEATHFGVDAEGHEEMRRLVDTQEVTAILFPTDKRMLRFVAFAEEVGIRVPDSVSVTGMDGTSDAVKMLGFTSVELPVRKVARRAAEVMRDLLRQPDLPVAHELFKGDLLGGTSLAHMSPNSQVSGQTVEI